MRKTELKSKRQGKTFNKEILREGTVVFGKEFTKDDILEIYNTTISKYLQNDYIIPLSYSHDDLTDIKGVIDNISLENVDGKSAIFGNLYVLDKYVDDIENGSYPNGSPGIAPKYYDNNGNEYGQYLDHFAFLGARAPAQPYLLDSISTSKIVLLNSTNVLTPENIDKLKMQIVVENNTTKKEDKSNNNKPIVSTGDTGFIDKIAKKVTSIFSNMGNKIKTINLESNTMPKELGKMREIIAQAKDMLDQVLSGIDEVMSEGGGNVEMMGKKEDYSSRFNQNNYNNNRYNQPSEMDKILLESRAIQVFDALMSAGRIQPDQKERFVKLSTEIGIDKSIDILGRGNYDVPQNTPLYSQQNMGETQQLQNFQSKFNTAFGDTPFSKLLAEKALNEKDDDKKKILRGF